MFKKIISIAMALVVIIGGAFSASALCVSEDGRPGIVGMEHVEAVKKLNDAWNEGEVEIAYMVEMIRVEGYWVVQLTGHDIAEDYMSVGFYDHCPTEEELDILWANRLLEDEMMTLMEQYGF